MSTSRQSERISHLGVHRQRVHVQAWLLSRRTRSVTARSNPARVVHFFLPSFCALDLLFGIYAVIRKLETSQLYARVIGLKKQTSNTNSQMFGNRVAKSATTARVRERNITLSFSIIVLFFVDLELLVRFSLCFRSSTICKRCNCI
jgi:hypothetical protein